MGLLSRTASARAILRVVRQARTPGGAGIGERAAVVPAMLRDALTGRYDGIPRRKLALMGAAALYVASPVDVVPEALLLLIGTADDLLVATWLAGALLEETERYLAWRDGGPTVVPGEVA